MRIMRGIVREFNVYRWAGRMLLDAAMMRERDPYGSAARFATRG
jgi:trehalose 6-phosphate synthase